MSTRRPGRRYSSLPSTLALAISLLVPVAPSASRAQVVDAAPPPAPPFADSAGACMRIGAIGSVTEDRARVAQLAGERAPAAWLLRRSDPLGTTCAPERTPGVRLLPASAQLGVRTSYEGGRNDGALWQGAGVNSVLSAGVRLQYSVFTLDFAPVLAYQQNADFAIAELMAADSLEGISRFANPWFPKELDIPQRFGDESYLTLDLGQSRLSALLGPVSVGVSNQNLWWGPGVHNALLMTNTAPGFLHGHVSSARPLDIGFARLEFSLTAGQLRRSEYQDTLADRSALFRGLVLTLEPKVLEGLYLGAARTLVGEWQGADAGEILDVLFQSPLSQNVRSGDNPAGNSPGNQLISLFARWVMPASRFEVWGEWGREDHAGDLDDLLQEPDHSQGWVLGFQKLLGAPERPLRIGGEWTDISHFTPPRTDRFYVNWYAHPEGSYTHRGQWLGTATGTGGDSQHLWADAYWGRHSAGGFIERVRRQDHAYYLTRCCTLLRGHDVEITLGARGSTQWRGLDLSASLEASHRYNRSFLKDYDNLSLRVGATWWPQAPRPEAP